MLVQLRFVIYTVPITWLEVHRLFYVSVLVLYLICHIKIIRTNLDATSGTSRDWAFGSQNTPLSYTFELRPIRGSSNGFLLNPNQIIPNNEEVMNGIKAMVAQARAHGHL